ncbi:IS110 family RNA-guided transposase [Paraglaciecola arctica]|uniref:Transposase IS116/IS110/IS902 n=1 Tax=Paraglaciecola arctica BSs20135 TaxID=493475 RepID=K6Y4N1_9ALTE|nr:IS110 family transposase [Paraglaciecola arctica]GAC18896.1 transposase IS116/IS110/IS902 [Paraglaciecola arctica BSs20135]
MSLYCGIDLHSNNHVVVVTDEEDNKLMDKRIINDLDVTVSLLSPFKNELKAVAVESTFNWYWLVDGLIEHGFKVELVNTTAVKQYDGLKYSGDHQDAFHLAQLMRLGVLPTGYIYPPEYRAIRDLLRRRRQLVRHASTHVISIQNQIWRSLGYKMTCNAIRRKGFTLPFEKDGFLYHSANSNLVLMRALDIQIKNIEQQVLDAVSLKNEFTLLRSMTGVGPILGLTIMLETGDIQRFDSPDNYASYCRCVNSIRESNGKKKGTGNRKAGNKYLSWAFSEAAHYMVRFDNQAKRFYERKRQKRNGIVAIRAVAHKLSRAVFHMLKNKEAFDIDRVFH